MKRNITFSFTFVLLSALVFAQEAAKIPIEGTYRGRTPEIYILYGGLTVFTILCLVAIYIFAKKLDYNWLNIRQALRPTKWKIIAILGFATVWFILSKKLFTVACKLSGINSLTCPWDKLYFFSACHPKCYTFIDIVMSYLPLIGSVIFLYLAWSVLRIVFSRE